MPTVATDTYTNIRLDPYINPEEAMKSIRHVAFVPSQTLAKGTILGQVTATGLWKAYATGNSDGSETARLVLQYSIVVDGTGLVTIGNEPVAKKTAPCYTRGDFRSEDLVGLDAPGLLEMGGHIVVGTLVTGHITF